MDAAEAALLPTALVATTVNVYAVPLVSPVTIAVSVLPPTVAVLPPGDDVTVYPVMALPPLFVGAVQVTVAWALPPVAVPIVGAPGTVAGVTELDAAEAALLPMALVAKTVNVYAVPLVRPVTVAVKVEPPTVVVAPPGDAVAVYQIGRASCRERV